MFKKLIALGALIVFVGFASAAKTDCKSKCDSDLKACRKPASYTGRCTRQHKQCLSACDAAEVEEFEEEFEEVFDEAFEDVEDEDQEADEVAVDNVQ